MYNVLYESHAGSWAILVLLFIVSFILLKAEKPTGQKVTHMILRLFFVIMVGSGIGMLFMQGFPLVYVVKGILALWLIYVMEAILARTPPRASKGTKTGVYWVQLVIALVFVVWLGYGNFPF